MTRATPLAQRGAALLLAMLTVALVATLAAGAAWWQWQQLQVEQAQRSQQQMAWLLLGAQDWSRLILREDANSSAVDHLSEPWALPLQEARLQSFLSLDGQADTAQSLGAAFLSGRITDLQSRLNVFNLVEQNKRSPSAMAAFGRLFARLGLPTSQLDQLSQQLLASTQPQGPLPPQSLDDLALLGLPESSLQTLAPYVTWLPARTAVNLNTAPPEVLMAVLPGLDASSAQTLVRQRANAHFKTVAEALQTLPGLTAPNSEDLSVASRYFEVQGRLRLDDLVVEQRSVLEREAGQVRVLYRLKRSLQSQPDVYPDR